MGAFTYDTRNGRFFAHLRVPDGNGDASRLKLTGVAQEITRIPVLRHRLSVNEAIEQDDIEWLAVPAKALGRNTVLDSSELIGMSPRRTIAPGKPIRTGDLRLPVLVEKSSIVTIELKTDRMRLSVQGRAMEAGAKGEGIRVMNTQSKKVVTAIVLDENTVEVATVDAVAGIN
jgi:flagella basal body P-ring formation protein FlgA